MAPKQMRRIVEEPPPAVSSEEEEGEESEEENDVVGEEDEEAEEDEGDEDEDDDDEKKSHVQQSIVISHPSKLDSESDSETDSGFDSTQPSPCSFTIKPIVPKPQPKSIKSSPKRPADDEPVVKDSPNKKTKVASGGEDGDAKKGSGAIQRLWSEDDEIAVLNGMIQFQSEEGADPYADMGGFHQYIKKYLHADVSKNQLMDKIRRLKKKYQNNLEKGENFSKAHDAKSFELSKKIWGTESGNTKKEQRRQIGEGDKYKKEKGKQSGEGGGGITLALAKQGQESSVKRQKLVPIVEANGEAQSEEKLEARSQEKREAKSEDKRQFKSEEKGYDVKGFAQKNECPHLTEWLETECLSDGVRLILRERLGRMGKEKLSVLEGKWRSLKQAELELFVKRRELIDEHVKMVLDAIRSEEFVE